MTTFVVIADPKAKNMGLGDLHSRQETFDKFMDEIWNLWASGDHAWRHWNLGESRDYLGWHIYGKTSVRLNELLEEKVFPDYPEYDPRGDDTVPVQNIVNYVRALRELYLYGEVRIRAHT